MTPPPPVASVDVAFWQALLSHVDLSVPVTGRWCELTAAATAEWQRSVGLEPTGTLDCSTWNTAAEALAWIAERAPSTRPSLTPGDRGEHVRYAQRRLVARGHRVTIDGVFSPAMRRAVDAFRVAEGMQPAPGIDEAVWAALG